MHFNFMSSVTSSGQFLTSGGTLFFCANLLVFFSGGGLVGEGDLRNLMRRGTSERGRAMLDALVLYDVSVRDWKISGPNAAVMAESRSPTVNDWKEPSRMKGKQKVCARSVNLPSRPRDDHRKISAICEASACLDRNRWRL